MVTKAILLTFVRKSLNNNNYIDYTQNPFFVYI